MYEKITDRSKAVPLLLFIISAIFCPLFFLEFSFSRRWPGYLLRKSRLLGCVIFEPPRDKTNKVSVRPAKTQISLGFRPVYSESSLCAQWVAKDPRLSCGKRRL